VARCCQISRRDVGAYLNRLFVRKSPATSVIGSGASRYQIASLQAPIRVTNWAQAVGAMTGVKPAGVLSDRGGEAAVAEFIRTKGVTRCPTACVLPTQAAVAAPDRAALQEYAAAREERRARAAARQNSFFPMISARPGAG